jgi:hypothetical protein
MELNQRVKQKVHVRYFKFYGEIFARSAESLFYQNRILFLFNSPPNFLAQYLPPLFPNWLGPIRFYNQSPVTVLCPNTAGFLSVLQYMTVKILEM